MPATRSSTLVRSSANPSSTPRIRSPHPKGKLSRSIPANSVSASPTALSVALSKALPMASSTRLMPSATAVTWLSSHRSVSCAVGSAFSTDNSASSINSRPAFRALAPCSKAVRGRTRALIPVWRIESSPIFSRFSYRSTSPCNRSISACAVSRDAWASASETCQTTAPVPAATARPAAPPARAPVRNLRRLTTCGSSGSTVSSNIHSKFCFSVILSPLLLATQIRAHRA